MKKLKIFFFGLFLFLKSLEGTPSPLFWTNCITDIQKDGTVHLNVDDYFTVFQRCGRGSVFNTDVGLLFGLFDWEGLSAEGGVDLCGASDYPIYFNGKIGVQEDWFFPSAPAFNVGIFGIGTRTKGSWSSKTNVNVVDFIFGKTLPESLGGRFFVGGYSGSSALGECKKGFMVGYQRFFCETTDSLGEKYYTWIFSADWASGKNLLGGGGVALTYFFTPKINIQTGPVWFNDTHVNGSWKWSVQIGYDIDLGCK